MVEMQQKRLALVSNDTKLVQAIRTSLSSYDEIELTILENDITGCESELRQGEFDALLLDIDAQRTEELDTLRHITRSGYSDTPVVVVTQEFSASAVRLMVQLKISDFLVKPVSTSDIVRSCMKVIKGTDESDETEAQIYTFMPVAGGVGVTTLALHSAYLLHKSPFTGETTCIVDLNLQQGCCAEYLDLEPRFDITEIEKNPERLDRQLLEVMLSYHECGLSVISAPYDPAEQRSFDASIVTRLLDLVAAYFDNVIIDMPRTWFSWTDDVLRGSDHLFLVTEMTVPCIRHTQRMMQTIEKRLGKQIKPKVIANRYTPNPKAEGLSQKDIKNVIGESYSGHVSNNYRLVREAVDRGVPLEEIQANSNVTQDLTKLIMPSDQAQTAHKKSFFTIPSLFARRAG